MRANRREPVSVPFWFQSKKCRPHGGLLQVSQQLETGAMRGLINCSRQPTVLKTTTRTRFRPHETKSDWSSEMNKEVSRSPFQDNKLSGTVN